MATNHKAGSSNLSGATNVSARSSIADISQIGGKWKPCEAAPGLNDQAGTGRYSRKGDALNQASQFSQE